MKFLALSESKLEIYYNKSNQLNVNNVVLCLSKKLLYMIDGNAEIDLSKFKTSFSNILVTQIILKRLLFFV